MAEFLISAFADEGGKTIEEQIDACKENNITHIELRGINGKNISDFSENEAKELRKVLDDAGMGVSAIGSPFGKIEITDDFGPHFELFKKSVENACILGTENIRMFSFYFTKGESYSDYRDEVFERLNKMAEYSLKSGIRCCLENEKGIYGDNAERSLDLLSNFKGKLFGVFDPANFIQCGQETVPAYEMLKDYILYLHIKDCRKDTGFVVPSGYGDGHIKEILSEFKKKDGKRFLTIEPHLKIFDGLGALEKKGGTFDKLKNSSEFTYSTNREAFKAAADALFAILDEI